MRQLSSKKKIETGNQSPEMIPDFDNTKIAFRNKSDEELRSSYRLFKALRWERALFLGGFVSGWLLKLGLPLDRLIRRFVFDHFCGGETIEDSGERIAYLYDQGIQSILDYAKEGEAEEEVYESVVGDLLGNIRFAANHRSISFCVFKPSSIGNTHVLEKVSKGVKLNSGEQKNYDDFKVRIQKIASAGFESDVKILIDAEESWFQRAVDIIVEDLMAQYNTDKPIIFNTIQLYRTDRLDYLQCLSSRAKKEKWLLGVKLVRGAYLEKEWKRAKKLGYPSPVFNRKEDTDREYDQAVRFCMDRLDHIAICAGTHNQFSTELLVKMMKKKRISRDSPRVHFAQLLGMRDNLSYNLARYGYQVSKYMPYGPVKELIPYLLRRVQENSSIKGQTISEISLIETELHRRQHARIFTKT